MTITEIIRNARGRAGSGGAWRVETHTRDGVRVAELWHYAHRMLVWNTADPADESVLDYSTGWGSVSDQGAMNKAFRELGLPLYYSRKGGASIDPVSPRIESARAFIPTTLRELEDAAAGAVLTELLADDRRLCEHPDPWFDSEPGTVTFPEAWTY